MKKLLLPTGEIPNVNSEPVEDLDIRLKDVRDGLLPVLQASRVTHITVGRTINVGDYSNVRYEIGVDIGAGDSASGVLLVLDHVLANIQEPLPNARVLQYLRYVELSATQKLTQEQQEYIDSPSVLAAVEDFNQRQERWQRARNLLDELTANEKYTDHKAKWLDEPGLEGS